MLEMILKMSLATGNYVIVTAVIWRFWAKCRKTMGQKIVVGLFFGACSVASTHLGIDYMSMVLNVRDIGPLAAGLFFHPVCGVIAGVIGGVERFIAGEFWDIGHFTRIACSLSTLLAGFLSAVLHRWVYEGERPTVVQSFFLGAVMEVFHMYVVLISHRSEMTTAYYVIRVCSIPMIVFTGLGLAACSGLVRLLSGEGKGSKLILPRSQTPLYMMFQRWLLVLTLGLFTVSYFMTYSFQTKRAYEEASYSLNYLVYSRRAFYQNTGDLDTLEKMMNETTPFNATYYLLWEADGSGLRSNSFYPGLPAGPEDLALAKAHINGEPFISSVPCLGEPQFMLASTELDGRCLLFCMSLVDIHESRTNQMYESILSDILVFTVLYVLIALLAEKLVVRKLDSFNRSLARITGGHLDETVSVRSSSEFSQLSDDINETVTALRGYISAAEKRMEEELTLAAAIQEAALPRVFDFGRDDFRIYALMTPARHVGGDFYDFFFIDNDRLALVIADVSGKGIPAALFMMRSKTAIKSFARSRYNPGQILAKVNNTLCEGNDAEMFVSVWLGIINLRSGRMECSNAGHEYPVLMRAGGDYELVMDKHGLVLAAMADIPMKEYELQLNPGDRLFVYTDGVPEAINLEKEQYGTGRLVAKLNTLKDQPEQKTLEAVLQDIRDHAGDAEQFDDITMLGFTYLGPDKPASAQHGT